MKIRDPKTIGRVAAAAAVLARAWVRTNRFAYRPLTRYLVNDRPALLGGARYIYAFWHEYLFAPAYVYGMTDTAVVIGQHADGELITQVVERFGLRTVRGSTTRGGTAALLRLVRDEPGTRHYVFTPDGPKGPRRKCQFGTVYLASRTGLPVVPVAFGYGRCWRAGSWDRFALPLPFSGIRCVTFHPIRVPPGLGTKELEPYQRAVEDDLNHATAVAERWAETGTFDPLGYTPPPDAEVVPVHLKAWPSARLVRRR